jgi:dolichol kinase
MTPQKRALQPTRKSKQEKKMEQISMSRELLRKALHLMLLLVPIAFCNLGKWPSLVIFSLLTLAIVAPDYARRRNSKINSIFVKIFGLILRPHELTGDKLCGASWVGLAACLNFLIFKKEIAVTGFTIMVISDAAASIIGRHFPSKPFFEKSLLGAYGFAASGLIILISCGLIFHSHAWFYIFGLFALFCVTMFESRPSLLRIDDNFTIPIGFSLIMTFFDLVWNYAY